MYIGKSCLELGKKTYVMGILNTTPDSFSDGGKYYSVEDAVNHAKVMISQGVDIIDIGGESTRPNHTEVGQREELQRVIPIIKAVRAITDIPISIDTYKAAVARAAIENGANLINDIWGFKKDGEMAKVCADTGAVCCLMHNRDNQDYTDIIQDILMDMRASIDIAKAAGVSDDKIILDPGIGFAKSYQDNITVMQHLEEFHKLGYPLLLGTSRKSMIGLTLNTDVTKRMEGTIATSVLAAAARYDFVRVHDIEQNVLALKMTDKILRNKGQ